MANLVSVGIASYKAAGLLERTVRSVRQKSTSLEKLSVFHNPSPGDGECRDRIAMMMSEGLINDVVWSPENVGYAGAVARFMSDHIKEKGAGGVDWSHFIYLDNDVEIITPGWDTQLSTMADSNPELGMVYPNWGPYNIQRPNYKECMWGVGFCFLVTRKVITEVGLMDCTLGHQEEADYALRVRLAGYKLACIPEVVVNHLATTTNDPASMERINAGVIRFVDKWNHYFCGKSQGYHSPNVLRWEDWHPNALYLEEFWKPLLPELNKAPAEVTLNGAAYDLIMVPRYRNFYRGRII